MYYDYETHCHRKKTRFLWPVLQFLAGVPSSNKLMFSGLSLSETINKMWNCCHHHLFRLCY